MLSHLQQGQILKLNIFLKHGFLVECVFLPAVSRQFPFCSFCRHWSLSGTICYLVCKIKTLRRHLFLQGLKTSCVNCVERLLVRETRWRRTSSSTQVSRGQQESVLGCTAISSVQDGDSCAVLLCCSLFQNTLCHPALMVAPYPLKVSPPQLSNIHS